MMIFSFSDIAIPIQETLLNSKVTSDKANSGMLSSSSSCQLSGAIALASSSPKNQRVTHSRNASIDIRMNSQGNFYYY